MNRLRNLTATAVLVILAGCAISEGETPAQRLYAAQATFNAHLGAAAAYVSQPDCTADIVVGCGDPGVKSQIRAMVLEADRGLDRARAALGSLRQGVEVSLAADAVRAFVRYLVAREIARES